MTPIALLTRSHERSETLIDALQRSGRTVLIDPLFQVVPFHEDPEPDLTGCTGLITTSLYGYQELVARLPATARALPLYCVGESTANAARLAGMTVAACGQRIDDLIALISEKVPGPDQWMLYGRGWVVTHNLPEMMEKRGVIVKEWTIYDTPAATALSPEVKTALEEGAVRDVFLFSGQAATTFVELTKDWLNEGARRSIRIFAISDRVAAAIPSGSFGRLSIASQPDLSGMIAAFEKTERSTGGDRPASNSGGTAAPAAPPPRRESREVPLLSHFLKDQEQMARRATWAGIGAILAVLAVWGVGTMDRSAPRENSERQVAIAPNAINLPPETEARINELTQQSQATLEALNTYKEDTGKLMDDMALVLDQVAGPALGGRLHAIEEQISDIAHGTHDTSAFGRFLARATQALQAGTTPPEWQNLSRDLTSLMGSLQGLAPEERSARLSEATVNGALPESLAGLSPQELQAAALLLSMAQLREATARDNTTFENDLGILRTLVGESNPDLLVAMDRLAPHAKGGILTPAGLGLELRALSGDLVSASLRGEGVSVGDTINARVAQMVQITRDGQQINGTPTQQTIATAQQQLDAGDVDSALATLQTLRGPEADLAAPFITKAQATQAAQDLMTQLEPVLNSTLSRVLSPVSGAQNMGIGVGSSGGSAPAPYTSQSAPAPLMGQP